MGKAPMLIVEVYDQDEKLISSNSTSWLRKQENERLAKLEKQKPKKEKEVIENG